MLQLQYLRHPPVYVSHSFNRFSWCYGAENRNFQSSNWTFCPNSDVFIQKYQMLLTDMQLIYANASVTFILTELRVDTGDMFHHKADGHLHGNRHAQATKSTHVCVHVSALCEICTVVKECPVGQPQDRKCTAVCVTTEKSKCNHHTHGHVLGRYQDFHTGDTQ